VSTIAISWNIYNNLQDRPKVKIETSIGFFEGDTKKRFFFVKAINKGKRAVHLSSVGLREDDGELVKRKTIGLPCELKEGKAHNEWFEMSELKDKKFNFAWYRAETGKLYKSENIKKKLDNYFKRGIEK
jgi:hypothetical protein